MKSSPAQIIKWLCTRQQGSSLPNREKAADCIEQLQACVAEMERSSPRCECCGYLVHHREHLGCIRAADKVAELAQASNGQAIDGLWQPASVDDGMRNMDASDVFGGQTDCEPATVAVDAGALAELRESMAKFRALPESAVFRPAGGVARERVMEAARRLLVGGTP